MQADTQPRPLNNLSLKVLALVFGYTLWRGMCITQTIEVEMQAPISFYNQQGLMVDAPEAVKVTLLAKRTDIAQLNRDIAVHINAHNLQEGQNTLALNKENLLLPDTVKLLNCTPESVLITAQKV